MKEGRWWSSRFFEKEENKDGAGVSEGCQASRRRTLGPPGCREKLKLYPETRGEPDASFWAALKRRG